MNTEQREEIETLLSEIEKQASPDRMPHASGAIWASALLPLTRFARQQLNLRVDVDLLARKLADTDIVMTTLSGDAVPDEAIPAIEALVLECLTTTPEEKA